MIESRPAPAAEAQPLLGGTVLEVDQYGRDVESGTAYFLANTEHALRALLSRRTVKVLVEMRCSCGGCLALVLRRPHGDLLLTAIADQNGGHAAQALWLDQAERVPSAVCHCGGSSQGPHLRHVERIREDVQTAERKGSKVVRSLHPPDRPARRMARTPLPT